jgi:hypothetical protein
MDMNIIWTFHLDPIPSQPEEFLHCCWGHGPKHRPDNFSGYCDLLCSMDYCFTTAKNRKLHIQGIYNLYTYTRAKNVIFDREHRQISFRTQCCRRAFSDRGSEGCHGPLAKNGASVGEELDDRCFILT